LIINKMKKTPKLVFAYRRALRFVVLMLLALALCPAASGAAEKFPFLPEDSIATLQAKIEANGYAFTVAPNWITRLPVAAREKLLSRRPPAFRAYPLRSADAGGLIILSDEALPSAFDWRDVEGRSYIGPVRNQGNCGSCYAFGACAAAEGVYNVAMELYDENCLDLSEAFLAFCLDQYYSGYSGCAGSDYDYEELDALVERGVCLESAYPYTAVDLGCVAGSEEALRAKFTAWYRIPCGDVQAIKSALITYGVLDAAVLVTSAFQAYSGGVYTDGNTECDPDLCYYTATNHCIALVGWQDTSAAGDGYWILRNSWGPEWGEDGYMRIAYRSAHVACEACYLVYEPLFASISGSKWNDYDGDGVRDGGEPGLSHWKIYLDENRNGCWDAGERYALTDENGDYAFTGLNLVGTYIVAEEAQAGWTQTWPPLTEIAGASAAPSTRCDELSPAERARLEVRVSDSPPTPPSGFHRTVVRGFPRGAVVLSGVPTSTWTYGCSATAAGMLFGYYDRNGYGNMYSGPANGGVAPLVDLGQGADPDNPLAGACSLIATMAGFDGRSPAAPGHVDDYWIAYGETGPDPWETGGVEHVWGECLADYLGTNQWKWNFGGGGNVSSNGDGATTYFTYNSAGKLYDPIPPADWGLPQTALCHGLRLFAESRGYQVAENYNQRVDSQVVGGFSFADFKYEIDQGRPVLIHVVGHTMLGVGYDNAEQTIYLHDTWDNLVHAMDWGGSYSGMTLVAVTVLRLAPVERRVHCVKLEAGANVTGIDFGNQGPSPMNTVRDITAGPDYYAGLQSACDAVGDGAALEAQIGNYIENLLYDRSGTSVSLEGGFDSTFADQVGMTKVIGSLTIAAGTLTVDRLLLQ